MEISQSESVLQAELPSQQKMQQWAAAALCPSAGASCALRIVSLEEMTELNHLYANKPKPTNVLSFPLCAANTEFPSALQNEIASLGDIAICAEVVAKEAQQQGKSLEAHWAHMIVHGVLHLRGFDHIQDEDAQEMEAEEIRILALLGFANPYQTQNAVRSA